MEEFIVLNQKPNIVYAYPKFISKWGANYFSVNRINIIRKIKKSNIECDLLSNKVAIQNNRRTPKKKSSELYVGLADVNTQTGEITENNTINEGITGTSNVVRKGQILFSKLRPNLNKVTICPQSINEALASTEFCVFKTRNIDGYYLFAVLKSNVGLLQVIDITTGSTLPRLDTEDILNLLIPIPSPEIQKYIGDKVRKAEGLREEAKRLKKEAEEIFNQNYEQIRKNNSKFEWVNSYYLNEDNIIPNFYKQYELLKDKKHAYIEFENIIESIKCGIPVRSDMRIGDIYPFYGASGVTDNIGDYNFDGEYLIVAQDGSIGLVNVARNKFWANNHVWVVQVKEGWDLEFLELYLNKYNYWISLTTGSVVPKVTSENLKRLLVPKIDYEIQRSIGDKIREAKYKDENSKMLIEQAKNDVEDLIEGNFDMSKVKANN